MANTYMLLGSGTASGSTATIEVTNIPATYTDLLIKISGKSPATGGHSEELDGKINNLTTNMTSTYLQGASTGGTASIVSGNLTRMYLGEMPANDATVTSIWGMSEIYIPRYSNTTQQKTMLTTAIMERNQTTNYLVGIANNWNNSSTAISSIYIYLGSASNVAQYSTIYVYGISN